MATTRFVPANTASTVLALSKAAWRVGIAFSNLDEDADTIGFTINDLAGEIKSLGNLCDLVYASLEEVIGKSAAVLLLPAEFDDRIWDCLAIQVDEISRTMQELEFFVKIVRGEETRFIGQAQRLRKLDKSRDRMASTRTRIGRHVDGLRLTLHLINMVHTHFAPGRAHGQLLDDLHRLQDMIKKLGESSEAEPRSQLSYTEVTLIQCAHDVIAKGTAMYEAGLASRSSIGSRYPPHNTTSVASWMHTLKSIRQNQLPLDRSDKVVETARNIPGQERHSDDTTQVPAQHAMDVTRDDSDDDLGTDLAKAALETGTKAFQAQMWDEASSLFHEALEVLQQLSTQQQAFCDIFSLQYQLTVCVYHTQEPTEAKEALINLVHQSVSTDEQRTCIYNAMHLLGQIYIRSGEIDSARSQCEKALQGRRRLLGKHSDASLESLALMAHIYALMNNRALAKSCLAMIPEGRRDDILAIVEASLGSTVEHLDFSSLLTSPISINSPKSDIETQSFRSRVSGSVVGLGMDNCTYGPGSTATNSPAASPCQSTQRLAPYDSSRQIVHSIAVASPTSSRYFSEPTIAEKGRPVELHTSEVTRQPAAAVSPTLSTQVAQFSETNTASRKAILEKIGCQPRDKTEEAVCASDHPALVSHLTKRRGFWRSSLRKRATPERVTALHFAALFGEIDMARRLLDANYNVNEVPFGYTTSLTPLNFAVGARKVDMVDFLIANGARPAELESWSTLAGQLMSRSWLVKTMCEAEKEVVPDQIIATMRVLLKNGWRINDPIDKSGKTVLHQAVSFWMGEYRWDLNLRATVTSFLSERGADPFQANGEGKTSYDLALASGHQDLLVILGRGFGRKALDDGALELVELPEHPL